MQYIVEKAGKITWRYWSSANEHQGEKKIVLLVWSGTDHWHNVLTLRKKMPLKFQEKKQTEQKCINWLGLHKILDHLKKKNIPIKIPNIF